MCVYGGGVGRGARWYLGSQLGMTWLSCKVGNAPCSPSMDVPTKSPSRKKMLLGCRHRYQNLGLLQIALGKYEKIYVYSPSYYLT